jgi:hypothetical protein
LQECRTRFVGITRSEPLQHQDDRASNQFFLAEEFAIDGFLVPHPNPGFCTFHAPVSTVFTALHVPASEARRAPFALPHPCEIVHTLEIEAPTLQPMTMAIPRGHKETDFIRFSRREKSFRGTWSMTLSLTTLADSVPAPSLQEHRQALEEIWRQSGSSLNFPIGYHRPRKRSDFGKISRFTPLPAPVVKPAEARSSSSPAPVAQPRPVDWPGDMSPQLHREYRRARSSRRRRRKGLRRKDWIWLAVAASLALLLSFLFYVVAKGRSEPKGRSGRPRPAPKSPVSGKDNQ